MAVTATNTRPTTSQVHVPGSPCCCLVFMTDRRSRNALAMAAPGIAHPGAAKIGRIRALTPRVRRAVPSWRLRAGETRATRRQMARAAHFVHPRIRGDFGQPLRIERELVFDRRRTPHRIGRIPVADRATRSSVESWDLDASSASERAGPRPGPPKATSLMCSISIVQLDNPCPHPMRQKVGWGVREGFLHDQADKPIRHRRKCEVKRPVHAGRLGLQALPSRLVRRD